MRTGPRKTEKFFKESGVAYLSATAKIDNKSLHYIQTGDTLAPTLVFVHGSPGSWDAWKNYMVDSLLLDKFRLIALDRPGFGHSDFKSSCNLFTQAMLLNALLEKLNNGHPTSLIGHSYGGPLVVQMALDRPHTYENLVILAGALDPKAEKPEKWRKPFLWFPLKYLVPGALRPSNEELWMLKEDLIQMEGELHKLKGNVLVIHGTEDKLVPYGNVAFMEKQFTNADGLRVIPICNENHFIVWTREDLIKSELLNTIQGRK